MRINSGKFKGRRIIAPKKLPVRPTTDFAKEGLFNILNNRIDFSETAVLDLFSGTGNISYEFASRGVPDITSIDLHPGCVQFIRKIATELEMPINPIKADVFRFISKPSRTYDLIFADPPYDFEISKLEELVRECVQSNLLGADGILIIEHSKQLNLSDVIYFKEARRYGGSVFSFFEC